MFVRILNCAYEKGQKCPVIISSFEGAEQHMCVCGEVFFLFLAQPVCQRNGIVLPVLFKMNSGCNLHIFISAR